MTQLAGAVKNKTGVPRNDSAAGFHSPPHSADGHYLPISTPPMACFHPERDLARLPRFPSPSGRPALPKDGPIKYVTRTPAQSSRLEIERKKSRDLFVGQPRVEKIWAAAEINEFPAEQPEQTKTAWQRSHFKRDQKGQGITQSLEIKKKQDVSTGQDAECDAVTPL